MAIRGLLFRPPSDDFDETQERFKPALHVTNVLSSPIRVVHPLRAEQDSTPYCVCSEFLASLPQRDKVALRFVNGPPLQQHEPVDPDSLRPILLLEKRHVMENEEAQMITDQIFS